jgi:hypothetical protein
MARFAPIDCPTNENTQRAMGNGMIIGWIGCPPMLAGLAKGDSFQSSFARTGSTEIPDSFSSADVSPTGTAGKHAWFGCRGIHCFVTDLL